VLHVHDYPWRKPRGEPGLPPEIPVVRYICAERSCAATWRILPAWLARHLWRVWPTVERTVIPSSSPKLGAAPIPKSTAERWQVRVASAARQLVVLLATSGGGLLEAMAKQVGLLATRAELVEVHAQRTEVPLAPGRRLADLAALVHRLERGIRLM